MTTMLDTRRPLGAVFAVAAVAAIAALGPVQPAAAQTIGYAQAIDILADSCGQDILKQVLTQLLLYYTRFLDLVKTAYPQGAPFAHFALSIPTLMSEIRAFSRNF
jgi:hypothetical protein